MAEPVADFENTLKSWKMVARNKFYNNLLNARSHLHFPALQSFSPSSASSRHVSLSPSAILEKRKQVSDLCPPYISVRHLGKKQLGFTVFVPQFEKNKCHCLCPRSWKKKTIFKVSAHQSWKETSVIVSVRHLGKKKTSFKVSVPHFEKNMYLCFRQPTCQK